MSCSTKPESAGGCVSCRADPPLTPDPRHIFCNPKRAKNHIPGPRCAAKPWEIVMFPEPKHGESCFRVKSLMGPATPRNSGLATRGLWANK